MARVDDVKILFRNQELLVIDKPYDVAMDGDRPDLTVDKWVHATQGEFLSEPLNSGNLVSCGNGNRGVSHKQLKFVHQLDYATSGVLCLAFSRDMASRLSHCFQMRYTKKWYLALVHGHLDPGLFIHPPFAPELSSRKAAMKIDAPIGDDKSDQEAFRMCVDKANGKGATTMVQVLEEGTLIGHPELKVTKVLLQPETGRRHQLRVHLLSVGHPILGDATYCPLMDGLPLQRSEAGKNEMIKRSNNEAVVATRMFLHAWKIKFFETVDDEMTHNERKSAKKKRRRETLGMEERSGAVSTNVVGAETDNAGTVFESVDPFVGLVMIAGGGDDAVHPERHTGLLKGT